MMSSFKKRMHNLRDNSRRLIEVSLEGRTCNDLSNNTYIKHNLSIQRILYLDLIDLAKK